MKLHSQRFLTAILFGVVFALSAALYGQGTIHTGDMPQAQHRAPLLREGSRLVRARGRIDRSPATALRTFIVDPERDAESPTQELILLPSTLLTEAERMIESNPDHHSLFEVTGEVFVYRDRNYLMLTHPPLLVSLEQVQTPQKSEVNNTPSVQNEQPTGEESAADIIRDLERSVGVIAPRPGAADADADIATALTSGRMLREGATVRHRRGKVRRTSGGAFIFVFDADAEGLADPPMVILPCLLVERLDESLRQKGHDTPLLISGRAFIYKERNYLLPSTFRIAPGRTPLQP